MRIDGKCQIAFFGALRNLSIHQPLVNWNTEKRAKLEFIELAPKTLHDIRLCEGYLSEGHTETMATLIQIALNNNEKYISVSLVLRNR